MKKRSEIITLERFHDAQKAERNFWRGKEEEIKSETHRQNKRCDSLSILKMLRETTNDSHLEYVLEIGGAGDPLLEYYQGGFGVVIDPLARIYKTELFPTQMDSVEYYCGLGEYLPFKSNSFDAVLLYNCIDHGIAPFDILKESVRVLREGGSLHILVDTYSLYSNIYRIIKERIFPTHRCEEHPHGLRFNIILKYLESLGFVEVYDCHDKHPYSRIMDEPIESIGKLLKDMGRGHRKLRAFYRLETK